MSIMTDDQWHFILKACHRMCAATDMAASDGQPMPGLRASLKSFNERIKGNRSEGYPPCWGDARLLIECILDRCNAMLEMTLEVA